MPKLTVEQKAGLLAITIVCGYSLYVSYGIRKDARNVLQASLMEQQTYLGKLSEYADWARNGAKADARDEDKSQNISGNVSE